MPKKVLVVDDSATVRQQVRSALATAGFEVLEATDGLDGVARIAESRDLSAVICDVNMPRLNGLELVEKVKGDPRNAALPIVILTTEGRVDLIQRAKAAGAKAWIIKPFKADLLVSAIRKLTDAA